MSFDFDLDARNSAAPMRSAEVSPENVAGSPLSETFSAAQLLPVGEVINQRYRVLRVLQSASDLVYICQSLVTGNRCTLKMPPSVVIANKDARKAYRDEVLQWVGLGDHPNLVLAYGLEESPLGQFVVMELAEGELLASRLASGALGWQAAACCGWQIANGMAYAGQVCGLVHRDLTPANVLITPEGVAKVTNFGLALARGVAGEIAGTPHYMAPEQWRRPQEVDLRSDIYAFGAMLYQLSTGRLPLSTDTATSLNDMSWMHETQTPADPRQFEPAMPEPIARMILRCLEKRPRDRFESFTAVRRILEPLTGEHLQGATYSPSRVSGLVNQSAAYHHLGCQEEAERVARNAVQLDARSVKARVALAHALAARSAYSQALGHLEEAYRLAPTEAAPMVNSAFYANLAGDRTRTTRWLQLALETLSPRQLASLTSLMIDLGQLTEAVGLCERIVQEDPASLVAWNSLSIACRRLGDLDWALTCADRTVELNPRYAKGLSNRATILVQLGRQEEAIGSADRALAVDAATAGAWAAKAAALAQLGRQEEGRACVMEGLEKLPGNALLTRALTQFPATDSPQR